MIELERTYLAKYLPPGLSESQSKEVVDVYIPPQSPHPVIRLRKNGDRFELTKKQPVAGDSSEQLEETIHLSFPEYEVLSRVEGKRVSKVRYFYAHELRTAEIDVFQESLSGLVLVDFEFQNVEEKNSFQMPEFCLAEVTHEHFIAGGMLCGKSYADIEEDLRKYNYQPLTINSWFMVYVSSFMIYDWRKMAAARGRCRNAIR